MDSPSNIAVLVDRVERLLLRHDELLRTNKLLQAKVDQLTSERNSLASRLSAARARVDTLIDRIPHEGNLT